MIGPERNSFVITKHQIWRTIANLSRYEGQRLANHRKTAWIKNHGTSPFLMGKSTAVFLWLFSIAMLVYQRVRIHNDGCSLLVWSSPNATPDSWPFCQWSPPMWTVNFMGLGWLWVRAKNTNVKTHVFDFKSYVLSYGGFLASVTWNDHQKCEKIMSNSLPSSWCILMSIHYCT